MRRYLIPILISLVLASGVVAGCGQSQKQQDILLLEYLDKTSILVIEYSEVISPVMRSYKTSRDAVDELKEFPDIDHISKLFEVVSNEKKVANEALEKVNSMISFLETTPPPHEAKTLHSLMMRALQTAKDGLLKLFHFSNIRYAYVYSMLNPSVPIPEYPPSANEELAQGMQLIGEVNSILAEVDTEQDNLLQPLKRYIPR